MKLIIGIPTLNRADLLNEALEKYFEDFKDTEIFIVDNGNQSIITREEKFAIYRPTENLNVSGSWNTIMDYAEKIQATHVLMMNDDVVLGRTEHEIKMLIKNNYDLPFLNSLMNWSSFILTVEGYKKTGGVTKKSLPKAQDGVSTLATKLYGTKKETIGNNVNTNRVLDNKGRIIGARPTKMSTSSKISGPNSKGIKPKADSSRVRAGVSAKTTAAPKSTEPVRKPSIEFGDPNVGFKYNKPLPKTKYEDAIINTKSPSTKTSGYTPKRIPEELKRKINMKKDGVNAAKLAIAGPIAYAASNMFKKKGGTVKSKKKK
jgi:hypothetical protein